MSAVAFGVDGAAAVAGSVLASCAGEAVWWGGLVCDVSFPLRYPVKAAAQRMRDCLRVFDIAILGWSEPENGVCLNAWGGWVSVGVGSERRPLWHGGCVSGRGSLDFASALC